MYFWSFETSESATTADTSGSCMVTSAASIEDFLSSSTESMPLSAPTKPLYAPGRLNISTESTGGSRSSCRSRPIDNTHPTACPGKAVMYFHHAFF